MYIIIVDFRHISGYFTERKEKEMHCNFNVKQKPQLHFVSLPPKPKPVYNNNKNKTNMPFRASYEADMRETEMGKQGYKEFTDCFTGCSHRNSLIRQGCTDKKKAISLYEISCPKETMP